VIIEGNGPLSGRAGRRGGRRPSYRSAVVEFSTMSGNIPERMTSEAQSMINSSCRAVRCMALFFGVKEMTTSSTCKTVEVLTQ